MYRQSPVKNQPIKAFMDNISALHHKMIGHTFEYRSSPVFGSSLYRVFLKVWKLWMIWHLKNARQAIIILRLKSNPKIDRQNCLMVLFLTCLSLKDKKIVRLNNIEKKLYFIWKSWYAHFGSLLITDLFRFRKARLTGKGQIKIWFLSNTHILIFTKDAIFNQRSRM